MSLYGVVGYHVTLREGHMIANHPIYGGDWLSCDPPITPYKGTLMPDLVATLIYFFKNYSYYIRGDRSPLKIKLQESAHFSLIILAVKE